MAAVGRTGVRRSRPSTGSLADGSHVRLDLNCGDLDVTSAAGASWSVGGTSGGGKSPEISSTGDRLAVTTPDGTGFDFGAPGWHWEVTLPQTGTMNIDVSVNAGSARASLAGMSVGGVTASVNAGAATLDLGAANGPSRLDASVNAGSMSVTLPAANMRGSVSVNAGSAELCAPSGVALRVQTGDNPLGSYGLEGKGLVQDGQTWSTPGFDTAPVRIELDLSANLGSITLNPENGCE